MESFGLVSEGKGMFSEVSEVDMTDVVGGSCGSGGSCPLGGSAMPSITTAK